MKGCTNFNFKTFTTHYKSTTSLPLNKAANKFGNKKQFTSLAKYAKRYRTVRIKSQRHKKQFLSYVDTALSNLKT